MLPKPGFGTAPILGRIGRRQSLRAVRLALDLGVSHFDTARSYGWGEAEHLVGEALRSIPRERVTIVSKCGIVPVARSPLMNVTKAAARHVLAVAPGLRVAVRSVASTAALQPSRSYEIAVLEASLTASLKALATDHLDILLLHNFERGREGLAEVLEWMERTEAKGLIRRHGVAISDDAITDLDWLAGEGMLANLIVQAPLSAGVLGLPERHQSVELIVHSPFRGPGAGASLQEIGRRLATSKVRAIVCSMFSEAHIRANVAALSPQ